MANTNSVAPVHFLRRPITVPALVILWFAFGLFLLYSLLFAVPKFEEIFKDFRTQLPASIQTLFSVSRFCRNGYVATSLIVTLIALPVFVVQVSKKRPKSRTSFCRMMTLMVGILCLLIVGEVIAISQPMFPLVETVNNSATSVLL